MYKLDLEKAEEPRSNSQYQLDHRKSKGIKKKTTKTPSTSASLTMLKPLTVWITTNCGKFLKRWECQITLPASWETCMQVKKQQLELGMEQWDGSKLGNECVKAVYCHPAYLTSMQSTSCKMLDCMYITNQGWGEEFINWRRTSIFVCISMNRNLVQQPSRS